MPKTYNIVRHSGRFTVDGSWDKADWQTAQVGELPCVQGTGTHHPRTQFRVMYDEQCIYVIFRVFDQYVRAVATTLHGEVWKDSCVEFFFTPYPQPDTAYFNLETNCCGVMLFRVQSAPKENQVYLSEPDSRRIQIVGSVPGPVLQEMTQPLTWTLEYAIPYSVLERYNRVERPAPGVLWRGNFYKCADACSHPHWLTWSPIMTEAPNFHRPDAFGILQFC